MLIAFRGRRLFRQYNPSKSHKYGIKMYKLCTIQLCTDGFTWASSIYCGTGITLGTLDKPGTVVVDLAESLLDEGRLIKQTIFIRVFRLLNIFMVEN